MQPIDVKPYDDAGAFAVFRYLDPQDLIEAQTIRGEAVTGLSLWADWRSMRGGWVTSHVLRRLDAAGQPAEPFAVVCLGNTGQAGVAQAAFLARSHTRYRRELVAAARIIRDTLPDLCAQLGIHRIEARCLETHPTAQGFLRAVGFVQDARMPGFGRSGAATFLQFAFLSPTIPIPTPTNEQTED